MRLSFALPALLGMFLALTLAAAPVADAQVPPDVEAAPAAEGENVVAPVRIPGLVRTDLEAWMDGFMPWALRAGDIAGAVVVVVKDGEVLLQKGYGYADLEAREPVDPERTLFRPGSVSKLFTWTAVMQLVEQGRVDLDADLNQYIDFEIPPRDGKAITLRQVMTHTTGMEEQIRGLITSRSEELVPLGDALKRWVPRRIHEPGATPAYSNYATALAGYVVERVSGESFDDYVERHILGPLGMASSSFRQPLPEALARRMSRGYKSASDGEPQDYEYISLAPAGSLAATGADMARFMLAHLQGGAIGDRRILSAEATRRMHTAGQATVGPLNQMMLGFYETTLNGHHAVAHGGDTRWFHSDLQLFPDDGLGLFVSFNSSGTNGATLHIRGGLVRAIADRYLTDPPPRSAGVGEAEAKEHAQRIAGTYLSSRRAQSSFISLVYLLGPTKVGVNEDGTISVGGMVDASGAPRKWRQIAPWVWQDVNGGERLAADVVDGRVVRFGIEPYASIMVFERMPWYRSPALLSPLLMLSLGVLLLTVIAWPVSALVRRYYRVPYRLEGADARAHRVIRIVALAVAAAMLGMLGLVVAMMSDFDRMGPGSDGLIIGLRLLATIVLPAGALLALWNAWQVLRSGRRWLAKAWAVLLALSCLSLLWIGWIHRVFGFGAYY